MDCRDRRQEQVKGTFHRRRSERVVNKMNQYDVWLVDLVDRGGCEQKGRRPAMIIQSDALNTLPSVNVVPITSTKEKIKKTLPTHVNLTSMSEGVKRDSILLCEQTTCIKKLSLIRKLVSNVRISNKKRDEINKAYKIVFDLY